MTTRDSTLTETVKEIYLESPEMFWADLRAGLWLTVSFLSLWFHVPLLNELIILMKG